ncbi:MAG TPA: UDP-N-acetylmuramoyl-L-alanyl-D-glutamate--2,6-diaminopimelate ligase [Geobacteraceae bacterium]
MRLATLLKTVVPLKVTGDPELEIQGLYYDSRQVVPGGLFFALKGVAVDGHRFIESAVKSGAAAVVAEDESFVPPGVARVIVPDARLAMSRMAAVFYGDPTARLPLVGITGTNGKTTTSYMIEAILEEADRPCAVLGTVSYRFRERVIPAPHTTPESVDLQMNLRELADAGAEAIVMEVSSHALEQKRVDGCRFDVGVFTNLTRDHLDYHLSMEAYLASKLRLFAELLAPDAAKPRRRAAVNCDDPYGETVAAAAACPVIRYGLGAGAEVTAEEVKFSVEGISGVLATPTGRAPFHSPMLGRFNLYNILAAAAAGVALELPLDAIRRGIEGHKQVPGRLERVDTGRGIALLVDYAHTGDALENVLRTLREIATARIVTVFGCGGDRDPGKRPIMGRIAAELSDLAIVTSDNPRTEDPVAIMARIREGIVPLGVLEYRPEELSTGFAEKGFVMVASRRDAIRLAARVARPGDIVLLAGKGHEDYQIIGTVKHHFDDREEGAAAFRELGAA